MVLQTSMLACRWVGSICHGYMCIMLYMNLFGVMVFQTPMIEEREWHQSAIGICALCYISLSVDLPSLVYWYARHLHLSQGGSICHRSMLHHHTSPFQLTIDPCYTVTPPLPIDHRSMLHCYTP